MDKIFFDTVVIGCGVIGLAVARESALSGLRTLAIDKEKTFGSVTSSRNSEVVHAGIYYKPSSLKAQLCVSGKDKLYDYCNQNCIPFRKLGKYIVALNDIQATELAAIHDRAWENGVSDLMMIDRNDLGKIGTTPNIVAALFSPSTGIVDSHAYMQQLETDFINSGGITSYFTNVLAIEIQSNGLFMLRMNDEIIVECKNLINAAGLNALYIRQMFCDDAQGSYTNCFKKGSYFGYSGKHTFTSLIYPIPEKHGLGIHLTLDLNGRARFGPDVEDCDTVDYSVAEASKEKFYRSIKQYWPDVIKDRLYADYSGIRPKVSHNGSIAQDFIIETALDHGHDGAVNLLNAESPGLTASLAIAEYVSEFLTH